jgi:hypothetical protein
VDVHTQKGGNGGTGGDGQPGGFGGQPGLAGGGGACAGGQGGTGGRGGTGGGGLGGHSIAIAFAEGTVTLDEATKGALSVGSPGDGGLGGNVNVNANVGQPGLAASCWDFGANAACP